MRVYLWLALSAILFAVGEYLSKLWANGPASWKLMLAASGAYLLGSLAWFPALRARNELITTGIIWGVFALAATVLIGAGLFDEPLTRRHLAGFVAAALAVLYLS